MSSNKEKLLSRNDSFENILMLLVSTFIITLSKHTLISLFLFFTIIRNDLCTNKSKIKHRLEFLRELDWLFWKTDKVIVTNRTGHHCWLKGRETNLLKSQNQSFYNFEKTWSFRVKFIDLCELPFGNGGTYECSLHVKVRVLLKIHISIYWFGK